MTEKRKNNSGYVEQILHLIAQVRDTARLHLDAFQYIKVNKPWLGLHQYGWTVKLVLLGGVLLGVDFFLEFWQMVREATGTPHVFGANMGLLFSGFSMDKFSWALSGGKKYLVLILLEIVTFHFIQHVLEKRIGREPNHSFKAFLGAEKRMIKVAAISWAMETVVRIGANIPLGIFNLSVLEEPVGYAIQFYFLGFAFVDNYHECFGLRVKESQKRTLKVVGAAVTTGAVAYVLMFVPLVGVLAASMIGAVTAAMAMEKFAPLSNEELAVLVAKRKMKKKKKN